MKKLTLIVKACIFLMILFGFYCFSIIMKGLIPDLQASSARKAEIQKAHAQEYKTTIETSNRFSNIDNIQFNIVSKQIHDGITEYQVDINTSNFRNYKTLDQYELSGELPFATLYADVISDSDFQANQKQLLIENYVNKFASIDGKPSQFNNNKPGYFFSLDKKENTIRYNQINHYGLIIVNPNIKMVRISVGYNLDKSGQTYTYIFLH